MGMFCYVEECYIKFQLILIGGDHKLSNKVDLANIKLAPAPLESLSLMKSLTPCDPPIKVCPIIYHTVS